MTKLINAELAAYNSAEFAKLAVSINMVVVWLIFSLAKKKSDVLACLAFKSLMMHLLSQSVTLHVSYFFFLFFFLLTFSNFSVMWMKRASIRNTCGRYDFHLIT